MTTREARQEAATETTPRLDFEKLAPITYQAVSRLDQATTKQLDQVDFDHALRELVRIRASQLNGCAYCVDMHTKDARALGEAEHRLYALPVWRETPFFTVRERAALAYTEAVTLLADGHVPTAVHDEVSAVFSPAEVAALLSLILTINAWNVLGVAARAWTPGSYQP